MRNLLRRQNGDDSYLYKKSKNGLFPFRKSPFLLKKGCQLSDSPLIASMDIKNRGLPLTREKNDLTEIILTYASSSEGAFPFFQNSGTMPSSSANTVEVTVTDSHRFPFRKFAKAIKATIRPTIFTFQTAILFYHHSNFSASPNLLKKIKVPEHV